jgi:hypothetical protein
MESRLDIFPKKIAGGQNFEVSLDLGDRQNKQIFHFGIGEKFLPFFKADQISRFT